MKNGEKSEIFEEKWGFYIENSRDFRIFGVVGVCLELQRGQVWKRKNTQINSRKQEEA